MSLTYLVFVLTLCKTFYEGLLFEMPNYTLSMYRRDVVLLILLFLRTTLRTEAKDRIFESAEAKPQVSTLTFVIAKYYMSLNSFASLNYPQGTQGVSTILLVVSVFVGL